MRKKLLLLFTVMCAALFPVAAQQVQTHAAVHAEIENVPAEIQAVLSADFDTATDRALFEAFIDVGSDTARKNELLAFYDEGAARIDVAIQTQFGAEKLAARADETLYALADALNQQMHTVFFKSYNKNCFTASDLKDRKMYDCVSATILYAALLRRYAIPFTAIETHDHVLMKILLERGEIDVETTNFYGFDPGTKKEFRSSFSKTTGFTYVSPVNYKRRSDLTIQQLFSLVVQNSISILTRKKDYLPAAKLGYILRLMRTDESGETSYQSTLSNLASVMSRANNEIALYDEAFLWMTDLPENQNKRALLNNTFLAIVQSAEKTGDYETAYKNLDLSFKYGIDTKHADYLRFRLMLTNNTCISLLENRRYDEARALIQKERDAKVLGENNLLKLLKSVTTKECNQLYTEQKYKEAIVKSLDCLELMPQDATLVNNLKVYYKGYVEYLKTADPKEVRAVIAEARKRFPNEKAFTDLGLSL